MLEDGSEFRRIECRFATLTAAETVEQELHRGSCETPRSRGWEPVGERLSEANPLSLVLLGEVFYATLTLLQEASFLV